MGDAGTGAEHRSRRSESGSAGGSDPALSPPATRPLVVLGALVAVLMVAFSARYGYHRDELYFLAAGRHPAWGYPDQGPLTPLVARLMDRLAPHSLVGFRLPSAVIAFLLVVCTGLTARELGAGRWAQLLAAGCVGISGAQFAVDHTTGTTAFDVLFWTVLCWLFIQQLRGADRRGWLLIGLVLGVALENKLLIGCLCVALLAGLLVCGPRHLLRSWWPWAGGLLAVVIWLPDLVWQASHGWPQFVLSRAIAAGGSTSSQPWYLFVPFELLLFSPAYVPIWCAGLWQLLHTASLRRFRAVGFAFLLLAVTFLVVGGKPYYLAGLYPALLAAGAEPTVRWARSGSSRWRRLLPGAAVAVTLVVAGFLTLPVLPPAALQGSPGLAVNPDAAETVGWPAFVAAVAAVYRTVPGGSVVLTQNYGEAGAIDHFGPEVGLPRAFSGHNGYGGWGPPPASSPLSVVAVGYSGSALASWFAHCDQRATIDDGIGLENEEQGRAVFLCTELRQTWAQTWPQVVHLG